MNLTFQSLTVEHFRCFAAKQTFNLAPGPGLWFLRGKNEVEPQLSSNGSGKSSILDAFCWVFDGITTKGLRNTDIRPWRGSKTPAVELKLLIDDKPITISRTAITNGLRINGKEVGPGEALKLLRLPMGVLTNTILLPQGQPLFFDRTPKEKFALFADVLPLDRWEGRSARAAGRVKELEKLEAEMAGELAGLKTALEQSEELLTRARKDSEQWETERQRKVKTSGAEIAALEKKLAVEEPKLDKADLANETAWIKLREMRQDLVSLQRIRNDAARQFNAEENKLGILTCNIERLKYELKELGEAATCPTCGQPVKGTHLAGHKKALQEEIHEIKAVLALGVPKAIQTLYSGAMGALENFETQLYTAEQETDTLQTRLNFLKPIVEGLKADIRAARAASQEKAKESNPYTEQGAGLRRQAAQLTQQIEGLEADTLEAQKQIERTAFWVKGFKDIALYLIEEVVQELEAVTNSLLGEVGLIGWQVNYALERETKSGTVQRGLNLTITPPYDYLDGKKPPGAIKLESWSGGESQRLRLVGALALGEVLLRRAGVSTNLEILDEPTQHLSAAGVSDLCTYLSVRAKSQGKTVWLIDHSAREGIAFAGSVTVTKTEKGSVISN